MQNKKWFSFFKDYVKLYDDKYARDITTLDTKYDVNNNLIWLKLYDKIEKKILTEKWEYKYDTIGNFTENTYTNYKNVPVSVSRFQYEYH